ncbi:hypothetical protein SPO3119 [Ruegeria pomeroyi DSS-3]|jgi:hypothetical protein|uniref:Uncharacterized protein n=2 Tax=Ruegeria pomeroyi TaxID=89184 RepID=Q5LNT4_RUEPO|nr:hypothetical protein SPO3119 [Ruegeria pomeroyi DSS-3]
MEAAMVDNNVDFDQRIRRLNKKHEALSRGYTARMRKDGLIELKPRRGGGRMPLRALVLLCGAVLAFKAFLLASLGPDSYDARLSRLAEGTPVEQAGAWVMQADPASLFLAEQIGPILR